MKIKKIAMPALVSALLSLAGAAHAAPYVFDFTGFHLSLDNIVGLQNPVALDNGFVGFDVFSLDGTAGGASQTYSFDFALTTDPGWTLDTILFYSAGSYTSGPLTVTSSLPASFNGLNESGAIESEWYAAGDGAFTTNPPTISDMGSISFALSAAPGTSATSSYGTVFAVSAVPVPVPEPDEWMLLLAGLGMVGWIARRRLTA